MTGPPAAEPLGFLLGRESPLASVGMFERPEWGGGFYAAFAPGEVVRVRRPIPSIVVQSLGRPLPPFASATLFVAHEPDWEIDLIHAASWLDDAPTNSPRRLDHVRPRRRLVVCAQPLADGLARLGALPRTDLIVAGDEAGLDALVEALAILITGHLLIGLELDAVLAKVCSAGGGPAQARACVRPGFDAPGATAELRNWIAQAAREGFARDLLLVQLAHDEAAARLRLSALDAFWQAVLANEADRPTWLTASLEASVTATVVVAFADESKGR